MQVKCDFCHENLEEPGALIFDSPDKHDMCWKLHMCRRCFGVFLGLDWNKIFKKEK